MLASTWHDLIGTHIAGRYTLRSLVYAGRRQAEFQAIVPGDDENAFSVALIEPEPEEKGRELAAIERAKQLQHPNLLHILDGGEYVLDGTPMLFVVTEAAQGTLAEALAAGEHPDIRELLEDILAALEWLHGQGLVYRSLDPETIVRAGGKWKLADLSQVHQTGRFEAANGGRGVPPEAASGAILPAWDVWTLGVLLRNSLGGGAALPPPFDAIERGCLEPDARKRLSIRDIRKMLEPEVEPVAAPVFAAPLEPGSPSTRRLFGIAAAAVVLTLVVVAVLWRPGKAPSRPPAISRPAAVAPPTQAPARESRPSPFDGGGRSTPAEPSVNPAVRPETQGPTPPAPVKTKPADTTQQTGRAEYFSDDLNGHLTATGEPFNNRAMTAASRQFPLGSRLRVTNVKNGRSVTVRVNDRGSSRHGVVISVTRRAAEELGFLKDGSARVRVQLLK